MKKAFLFSIFIFLFSNIVAQNKISLTLKDGSVINGIGRIIAGPQILFKKSEDAKEEFYNYKIVKKFTTYSGDYANNYEFKIVLDHEGVEYNKLLKVYIAGKVNLYLYKNHYKSYVPGSGFGLGGFGFIPGSSSKTTYYISKKGDDIVTGLKIGNTYSRRFKKIAKKYFGDCTDLIDKINSKHFNRYGIESVIKYYNENCN